MGDHAAFIESKTTQIAYGDPTKEIRKIFGHYFDGITIRHCDWGIGNGSLRSTTVFLHVSLFNMQCDIYHSLQCPGDLMTIWEKKWNLL